MGAFALCMKDMKNVISATRTPPICSHSLPQLKTKLTVKTGIGIISSTAPPMYHHAYALVSPHSI